MYLRQSKHFSFHLPNRSDIVSECEPLCNPQAHKETHPLDCKSPWVLNWNTPDIQTIPPPLPPPLHISFCFTNSHRCDAVKLPLVRWPRNRRGMPGNLSTGLRSLWLWSTETWTVFLWAWSKSYRGLVEIRMARSCLSFPCRKLQTPEKFAERKINDEIWHHKYKEQQQKCDVFKQ